MSEAPNNQHDLPSDALFSPATHRGNDRADSQLVRKALRERWPISEQMRDFITKQHSRLVLKASGIDDKGNKTGDVDPRLLSQQTKILIELDKVNIGYERLEMDRAQIGDDETAIIDLPDFGLRDAIDSPAVVSDEAQ